MSNDPTIRRSSDVGESTVVRSQPLAAGSGRAARRLLLILALAGVLGVALAQYWPRLENALTPLLIGVSPPPGADGTALATGRRYVALLAQSSLQDIAPLLPLLAEQGLDEPIEGLTPLMHAARHGRADVVSLLLERGADPNARGHFQRNALQYATESNRIDVARQLLDAGANVDDADNTMLTPLIMAADRSYTQLAVMLIKRGANVNIQQLEGWTALMDAAEAGNVKLVQALLRAGAVIDARHHDGRSALDMARAGGHDEVARTLRRHRLRGQGAGAAPDPADARTRGPARSGTDLVEAPTAGVDPPPVPGSHGKKLTRP